MHSEVRWCLMFIYSSFTTYSTFESSLPVKWMATLEVTFSFERWSLNVSLSSDGEKHKITHIRWFSLTENQIIWCEWEKWDMKLRVWTHHFHLPDCSETRMNKKRNIKYTIMHWCVPESASAITMTCMMCLGQDSHLVECEADSSGGTQGHSQQDPTHPPDAWLWRAGLPPRHHHLR